MQPQEVPIDDTILDRLGFRVGYLRQDGDSHWYVVPSEDVEEFDELLNQMYEDGRPNYDIEDEFSSKFGHYATGGWIGNIKVLIED